jgi:hypothetical protein
MHKSAMKCNKAVGKWCKNKHGASKIIDTLETYQSPAARAEEIGRGEAIVAPEATAMDTRDGKPLRLRPAAALVGRVLLASSRRNGLIQRLALASVRPEPKP